MKVRITHGLDRWTDGLAGFFRRRSREVTDERNAEGKGPLKPITEAERSLAAAMGWEEDPWKD